MKTVFFLDDSVDYLALMRRFVERNCGCSALTSTSYESTLENDHGVLNSDMAFLDINLGPQRRSGIDVYNWLRDKGYQKPIFFLTGHGNSSFEAQEAAALGEVRILSKPFPPDQLKALIGSLS